MINPENGSRGGVLAELKAKDYLSADDFSPFTADKVGLFFSLFNDALLKGFLARELAPQEEVFVDNVALITSRLIHRELNMYVLKLPTLSGLRSGAGLLPQNVSNLQQKSGHRGLREVYDRNQGGHRPLLSTEESWLEVTAQMATGEITIRSGPDDIRQTMEDYAYGVVHFLRLLAEENDGLILDSYILKGFDSLLEHYKDINDYYRRDQAAESIGRAALDPSRRRLILRLLRYAVPICH